MDSGEQLPHLLPGEAGRKRAVQAPLHIVHQDGVSGLHGRIQRVPEGIPCQTFQILPGGLLALTAAAAAGAPALQFQKGGTGGSGVPQQKCPDPQALAQPGEQATACLLYTS